VKNMQSSCEVEGYDIVSEKIKNALDLEKSPVAIKFALSEKDIPEGIEKMSENVRHCEMVQKAAKGETFYATKDEQKCKGGASALGLMEMPEKIKKGEFYYELGRFSSIGSAKRTMDAIPIIDNMMHALIYAPLDDAKFHPDIIVILCKPAQAMKLSQALVYTLGGRVESDFAGIQSVCGDAVAGPFMRKTANITLGCSGSRKFAGIEDEEVIVGLTGENIGCVVNALESLE